MWFGVDGRTLVSRVVDGKFPDYARIIPKENDKVIAIARVAFTAALRRISLLSEKNKAVYFDIQPGKVLLSSASHGIGSADEMLPIAYEGPPLKVCVHGGHALDFLAAADGETVTLALKDAEGAALFSDGPDYVVVMMLMRA
jgi:DNA polymerase-3 subunit beta